MEDLDQLGKLRKEIDAIDSQLLVLLNRRARLAQEIGRIKERNGRPVYAPERAEQLMRRLVSESEGPLDELAIRAIYREIMSASLALEKDTVIAAEGELAGLTHLAAKQQFGSSVRYTFHADASSLFDAVVTGAADCGVIPYGEEGPDAGILELLLRENIFLCSQIVLGADEGGVPPRYLVLGTTINKPSGHDQTALLLHLADHPGALASALEPFRIFEVNVLSIHSRRSPGGGLHFLLEFEGHASEESLQKVIEFLKSSGVALKVCGSYPRAN